MLIVCLKTRQVPHGLKSCMPSTAIHRKGDQQACGKIRGLSLLSLVGKMCVKILIDPSGRVY